MKVDIGKQFVSLLLIELAEKTIVGGTFVNTVMTYRIP
jgi:hypothetical protein